MLNKMKLLIFLFILLLVGWFYWFQYRPSEIKSFCSSQAKDEAHALLGDKAKLYQQNMFTGQKYLDAYEKGMYLNNDYENIYENCLHEKGL